MAPSIGFIGMGIMGEPMARNLLKSGKFSSVTVWNRTPVKVGECWPDCCLTSSELLVVNESKTMGLDQQPEPMGLGQQPGNTTRAQNSVTKAFAQPQNSRNKSCVLPLAIVPQPNGTLNSPGFEQCYKATLSIDLGELLAPLSLSLCTKKCKSNCGEGTAAKEVLQ
jgi:hypothetical protein